tara:strand:- start:85 stop:273 length:189 start_codon:yes stop_codon:yes gene_type:complete
MQFYNVRKKEKVEISEDKIEAVKYERTTKNGKKVIRYGVRAVDDDGTKLTKFCNKDIYDSLS